MIQDPAGREPRPNTGGRRPPIDRDQGRPRPNEAAGGPRPDEAAGEPLPNEAYPGRGLGRTILDGVWRVAQGFSVTFRQMFRKDVTKQYPKEIPPLPPRSHIGRHLLNRYENGLEKCIGCELCAWACPADAIYVEGADNTAEHRVSAGERYAKVYQINYLRCIMCGFCVEACPTRALTLTSNYEMAFETREDAVFVKEQLLTPPPPLGTAPGTEQGKSRAAFGGRADREA